MPKNRPLSITFIGCLFILVGAVGFFYHLTGFSLQHPYEDALVLAIRLLAILGGIFLLYGKGWARWVLVLWLAYHVILSAFHAMGELVMHALLLATIAYILFRSQASSYLRRTGN